MPVPVGWTDTRRAALALVARGQLDYSLARGSFEPREGYRSPAFEWLDEGGFIEPDYDAPPVGRVTRLVPVVLTDKGRAECPISGVTSP